MHGYFYEGVINTSIASLHAYEVGCFNKGRLNKGLQFGRAYQLARIGGNFHGRGVSALVKFTLLLIATNA